MPPRIFVILPFILATTAAAYAQSTAPTIATRAANAATRPVADTGTQIAVDSRLILVSNNFLDDFRIGSASNGLPYAPRVHS